MSTMSMGYTPPRRYNKRRMLRRCSNNTEADDVVLIDSEGDGLDNIIILDSPDYFQKNSQRAGVQSEAKRCPQKDVIFIDDDETNENIHSNSSGESDDNFLNNPDSSKRSFPLSKSTIKMVDENGDDCQFVGENKAPVKILKCRRTYSGRASSRNRYGLTSDSESSSSDSDCELMVDSFGKLQEEWEKASLRRKCDNQNTHSGANGFNNTSRAELQPEYGQTEEHSCFSSMGKASDEKEDISPGAKGDGSSSASSLRNEDVRNPNVFSSFYENCADDLNIDFHEKLNTQSSEPCVSKPVSYASKNIRRMKDSSSGKGDCLHEDLCSSGDEDGNDQCNFPECGSNFSRFCNSQFTKKSCPGSSSPKEKNLFSGVSSYMNYESRGKHINGNMHSFNKLSSGPGETSSSNLSRGDEINPGKLYLEGNEEAILENNGISLITEKEMLKETDEYKKALEEELASRQRALQIQAEEAQQMRRLLKRRKAERMRLLDMERRQKQRVEEMRETQKKDEENMNTKEAIRGQVRSELIKLETGCHDMASVLRGLGIAVGSNSLFPQLNEVRAAYKKALLTFHPDRASRGGDIRQQVEAEEKFKLISRMKDKYLPNL